MTYRRLFLWLVIGSTLLLAGAWWGSFTTGAGFLINAPKPPLTFSADLVRGDIRLYAASVPSAKWSIDIGPYPASDLPEDAEESLAGGFEWFMHSAPDAGFDPLGPQEASCYLQFPVWVAWILFVASEWAFCRVMEKRAGGLGEKELAEGQAAGKLGRETGSSITVVQPMEGGTPMPREHEK